ncbi:NADH-quinone oxidoreductase subunit J [Chloracidobacterium thermophilum]|uniref:NADH-quinone oxidoreductase subunit J family protein n=1 Tax=Chloracidobacterium thermophilum TaxID=458033 RepID=UPI0007388262|nr:NADH-quinone oxidoreductase subunit J [Chloracidobacterium thermophilum]
MTFQQLLFVGFAALVLSGAVSVVLLRNPLYGAFALITSFVGLSALYVLMGAQFIGAAQIVVYAGAIMMLFVFVIMLLNVRADEERPPRHRFLVWLALPLGVAFSVQVWFAVWGMTGDHTPSGEAGTVERVGKNLMTRYLLPFELTSVLILLAVVGALHLAKREKE